MGRKSRTIGAVGSAANKLEDYREIFLRIFDPQPAHVALLNLDALIIETNAAWNRFGIENGLSPSYNCIGKNYLSVCEPAALENYPAAHQAYLGLLEVIHTHRPKFTMIYPCHSPAIRRWYRMWVEPQLPDVPGIIVAHYLCAIKPITDPMHESETWHGSAGDPNLQMHAVDKLACAVGAF